MPYPDEGIDKATKPDNDINQRAKFLYVNMKDSNMGQCGGISRKESNRPGESHLISFKEGNHCDQQRCCMPSIRCPLHSPNNTIDYCDSKKYLCLAINCKYKGKG